jgi:two-component system, sensor histidine kinase PdtaS
MTPRRLILLLGGTMFAVAVLLFALLAEKQRRDALAEARRFTQSMAETLAGHAERLLDASNLVANVAILYAANRNWDEIASSPADQQFFQRFIDGYDYIEALWMTDAQGLPRLTSRSYPAPAVDTSDRSHFIALRDGGRELYISELLQSRVAEGANIVFARRLNDDQGGFRGIVQVVLHPGYFYAFYEKIQPPFPVAVTLFRDDLSMLVRYPRIDDATVANTKKWADRQALERSPDAGFVTSPSTVDGVTRTEAYQRVRGFPVLVSVGVDLADIHRRWLAGVGEQALFVVTALIALLFLVRLALQRLQREEAAVEALRGLTATLESRVVERTAELKASNDRLAGLVTEKERILRELNHRIKNSLQMISSLLDLQGRNSSDPAVVEQLGHASRRVLAVARVHQRLYSAKNVEVLEFAPYLRALCADLGTSLAIDGRQVKVHVETVERDVAADVAIPLGLIVSEAVTNAARHAYGESEAGVINVAYRTLADGRWQLEISDRGVGMEMAPGAKRPRGLGMQLIQALSEQIDAALEVSGAGGTRVTLTGPAATPGAAGAAGAG